MEKLDPVWCIFLRSLPTGGVERQFLTLANLISQDRQVLVVTLFRSVFDHELCSSANLKYRYLFETDEASSTPMQMLLRGPARLRELCLEEGVSVVYSARELANVIAAVAVRNLSSVKLFWGHRVSTHHFSLRIRLLLPLCRWLQSRVDCQIANSDAGLDFYSSLGLCCGRAEVLPNFVDSDLFRISDELRMKQRAAWGVEGDTPVVAIVGRIAPMKNHESFLRAAAYCVSRSVDVRFLVLGPMDSGARSSLTDRIEHYGLSGRVVLESAVPMLEMPNVYNGLDVLCSCSLFGEGFSNALAEAMACGCAVVATDVGAAKEIVGSVGEVVSPGDDQQYQEALLRTLEALSSSSPESRRMRILSICNNRAILERIVELGEA